MKERGKNKVKVNPETIYQPPDITMAEINRKISSAIETAIKEGRFVGLYPDNTEESVAPKLKR